MISHQFESRLKRVDSTDVDVPVSTTLSYDAGTDPFAVQAIFEVGGGEDRVWHFSRDLLARGSKSLIPHGQGDVKFRLFPVTPEGPMVLMCLRTNKQGDLPMHADIALPAQEVREFLESTHKAAQVTEQECDALVDLFLREVFEA